MNESTSSKPDPPASGRELELLYALNAAAASLQRSAHSEAEVLRAFCEQIDGLDLSGNIGLLDQAGERLVVRAVAQSALLTKTLSHLEELLDLRAEGYSFAVAEVDVYRRVVESGESIFVLDSSVVVAQMLPKAARRYAARLLKPFNATPAIFAPLISEGQVQGTLTVSGAGLSVDDVPAIETFANHVAVTLRNARLLEAAQQHAAELETLHQVGLTLTSSLDLADVLNAILEGAFRFMPHAQDAHIFLYQDDELAFGAARWADGRSGEPFAEPRPDGLTYNIARTGEAVVIGNVREHPLYTDAFLDWKGAIVGLPLKIAERVVGVMNVAYAEPHDFSKAELRALRLLGAQAAIAIENARLYAVTRLQAITDGLTGLYNVRHFYAALEAEIQRSRRYDRPCSLIMLDLDDFKTYNDRYGHLAGDDLLLELAALMREQIRQVDTAARYGGEEFVVILPETDKPQATLLTERLWRTIRAHEFVVCETQEVGQITASLGIATYPQDAQDTQGLVNAADMALLQAKRGKDQVQVAVRPE